MFHSRLQGLELRPKDRERRNYSMSSKEYHFSTDPQPAISTDANKIPRGN